jgi:hypothetical protein
MPAKAATMRKGFMLPNTSSTLGTNKPLKRRIEVANVPASRILGRIRAGSGRLRP